MAETRAIKRLLKGLESIRSQVITFSDNTRISEINACLTLLADIWKEFQSLEKSVKGKFDDANSDSVDKIEELHFDLKEKLIKLEKLYDENHAHHSNYSMDDLMLNQSNFLQQMSTLSKRENDVRLPRVNIPSFSGHYSEFPSFRDLFEASIHNNNSISKVHKLQYLKGLLKGEAYSLINHIAVTDSNYDEAWDKIKARYNKRKHVVHSLIKQFMEQPSIHQSCAKTLRHLSDVSDEVIRGLKVLDKQAETRDPWLIYILTNKLDDESKEAWSHETSEIDFPTLDHLFIFLNKRSDALESYSSLQASKAKPIRRINSAISQTIKTIPTYPLCSGEHYLGICERYLRLTISDRKQFVAEKKLCFNCLSANHQSVVCRSRINCRTCKRRHHVTLHLTSLANVEKAENNIENGANDRSESTTCNAVVETKSTQAIEVYTILPTVKVLIKDKYDNLHKCRALLDSGSQSSFVSENCAQRLKLQRNRANVCITGISAGSIVSKGQTTMTIQSIYDPNIHIEVNALIINKLPSRIPSCNISCTEKELFQSMQLADPDFDQPAPIDMIMGADVFFSILTAEQRKLNTTILQNTIFGWVVSGRTTSKDRDNLSCMALNIQIDIDIDKTLRKFWEIEEIQTITELSPEDQRCEDLFVQTHQRGEDGRYVVKLPFKNNTTKLGNSLIGATQRFLSIERKLLQHEPLRKAYVEQFHEYLGMGHMIEVPENENKIALEQTCYLPHHAIIKEDSDTTKVRVVFDGSYKTSTGISLNENLMVGPTIQPTLWSTLLRFRGHRVAMTADIERMYRQVIVSTDHLNFQRILWRENPKEKIRHYYLTRVTFGLACSAYLAIRVLQQLARDNADDKITQHILTDFYVDDLLSGSNDVSSALELKETLTNVLKRGGFQLRKWHSNAQSLCEEPNVETITDLCSDDSSAVKVLGIQWCTIDDVFTFKVKSENKGLITKRKIISEASRIFDPLGFVAPSIVKLKILFQKLWFLKIDWDDKLPDSFEEEYQQIRGEFEYFQNIKIHRFFNQADAQLHGFADASEMAYCAVVYGRVTDERGEIKTTLLSSKTKVAPIKKISLPRLELCAAHLLAKLLHQVKETVSPKARCFAWTDSSIVLAWLSTYPARWKTFVANRTSQILEKFPRQCWAHVKSADNPADHGSRGINPKQLVNLQQWWHGPEWLQQAEDIWPTKRQLNPSVNENLIEAESSKNKFTKFAFQAALDDEWLTTIFQRKSNLHLIFKVVAYVKRFIWNIKTRDQSKRRLGLLKSCEIEEAVFTCIFWVQKAHFSDDIKSLQRQKMLNNSSKLLSLAPFLDQTGILRVGGRLSNAECEFDNKHPVILPANHILTERIIWDTHLQNLHVGPTLTNNLIRQKYWIINGRTKIRSILKKCVICVKYARKTSAQLMGNLPTERVTPTRPFTNCGIDFAGPIYFASKKGRGGTNPVKGYICIFVCLSVKSLHIEPVSDLTSEAFLAALRRFASRRGVPKQIFTDNGSNFVGAKRILNDACQLIRNINNNYVISEYLNTNGISWHFNPPASPHFGGLWESAVKSVKTHLLKTTNNVNLTFEEMATLLCQVENILNSRPLCTTSCEDDYEVLTPSHFLIGSSTGSIPETEISKTESTLSRWQRIQSRTQLFWKKYYRDYLNNLQQRHKWQKHKPDVKIGDVVLIKEDNVPVSKWPLGRIVQVHPGNDNVVRVVTVKTSSTTLQRPVVKICRLPIG